MSHEIEVIDGVPQIAYAGETPWHGLGKRVGDDLTPQEMMKEAGLDWSVEKHDVFFATDENNTNFVRAPKKQALVRSNDGKYLDIVSDNWIPVQNEEAFEFFTDYVNAGGMSMHTAGSLHDGKIIWALAKVNDGFDLFGGKDRVESYLLLSNPHQFGRGVDVRFTPVRVVCNNTLSLSLEGKAAIGMSLNHRSEFDVERVRAALDEAARKMNHYKDMAEFLGSKRYNEEMVFEYFTQVFPKTTKNHDFDNVIEAFKSGMEKAVSRNAKQAMEVMELQPGAEYGRGTWWQAYNTVTFMTNHMLGRNDSTRLASVWYGTNKDRNVDALGKAIEYAEAS